MAKRVRSKPEVAGNAPGPGPLPAGTVKGPRSYSRGPYKNPSVQGRILAKALLGQSKRQIGQSEKISRATVSRILSMEDMKNAILDARKKFVGLLPLAIEVYYTALEKREGKAAMDAARHVIDGSQTAVPKTESLVEMAGAEGGRSVEDLFYRALHNHFPEEECHCGEQDRPEPESEKGKGVKV
ncbi:MAG: hypothetical protein ABSA41_17055 [Terriglobia bacterium]